MCMPSMVLPAMTSLFARLIKKVSPLVRYDFMSDHSDGSRYNATDDDLGELIINDYKAPSCHRRCYVESVEAIYLRYPHQL